MSATGQPRPRARPKPQRQVRRLTAAELRLAAPQSTPQTRPGRTAVFTLDPIVDRAAALQRITLSQLARRAGTSVSAARRYARRGLLPDPLFTPSWGWLFPPRAVERLALIRAARALGLPFAQIHILCAAVEDAAEATAMASPAAGAPTAAVSPRGVAPPASGSNLPLGSALRQAL